MRIISRKTVLGCGAAIAALALATGAYAQQRAFNVPAQEAVRAIPEFARQADIQIIAPSTELRGVRTPAVRGDLDTREALRLLLQGTGLEIASDDGRVISLRRARAQGSEGSRGSLEEATIVEEITVTGTHIRGVSPTAPVNIVTRLDIDRSGYSQIGDIMRSLPENFGGGQNPGVMAANNAHQNVTNSSTINLRGLGADATLVLLNGRRMAADGYGQAPDISSIPLAALERVEIVTDGSSATYGSDAVAGVTNFILRRNFQGVELGARFGGATQGGGFEQSYSVLAGASGDRGFALLNLDYANQDAILASDRDYTSRANPTSHLLRPYERTSALLSAGYDLSDRLSVSIDALWSDRHVSYTGLPILGGLAYETTTDVAAHSVTGQLDLGLDAGWSLRLTAGVADSHVDGNTLLGGGASSPTNYKNDVQYGELAVDGPLLRLPSGDLRVAFGIGVRDEGYVSIGSTGSEGSHDVRYLFGEAFVPLVPPSPQRTGLNSLDLSVSARIEDYSDFGKASTPKVGIRYVPAPGLTFRGTWGESFKAPSFQQMHMPRAVLIYPAALMGHAGSETAFFVSGGNPDLRPEESTSWTIGAEYSPPNLSSVNLGATYFNIDYRDRVVLPVSAPLSGLSDPNFASFVIWNPTPQQQADLIAGAQNFLNYSGAPYDPGDIVAVLSNTYANVASQAVDGVDLSYRQAISAATGMLDAFANATWIRVRQQTIPTLPEVQMSGTINNVPEFRARAGLSWSVGDFTLTGIGNYLSGSIDTGVVPNVDVGSWTTFDTTLSYEAPPGSSPLSGLNIVLSVSNLFDRDPPFAPSPGIISTGINFDSTNASPVGRFVALGLRKRF